ncbi:TA system antitoxin ParD family protein [Serratia sp. D1N4]
MTTAISVRLDGGFVEDVKVYADASSRSVPKQIEYWAKIGRMAEDNPDLPFSFIKEALLAKSEVDNGRMKKYERRTARSATKDTKQA